MKHCNNSLSHHWSTKKKAFCMEAYFANNLYKILQASFRESFSVVMLYQKAEFFTGFRSLESMGLGKILIQKV